MDIQETGLRKPISILMLSKDKATYLRLGAHSALERGLSELVLIEPGSIDESREICAQLISEFPGSIKLVTDSDMSPAEGLNNGLSRAQGAIVGVLNADDVYIPGALSHVREYFQAHPEVDVLLAGGFLINENTGNWKLVLPSRITKRSLSLDRFGSLTFFHQGMFYRRDRYPELFFNQTNKINWDKEFLINLFQANAKFGYLNLPLALFRINDNSLTYQGFSSEAINENHKYFDKLLSFDSNLVAAKFLGQALRILKASRLVVHTFLIHSRKYRMSKDNQNE
jgi:glycosyltransferase involved in cell wall biosynthesis